MGGTAWSRMPSRGARAQAAPQHWQAGLLAADDGTDWPEIMALAAGRDGGMQLKRGRSA